MPTPIGKSKLIVDIPSELKKDFKLYCTINDVPMTEIVSELIESFLNSKKTLEKG